MEQEATFFNSKHRVSISCKRLHWSQSGCSSEGSRVQNSITYVNEPLNAARIVLEKEEDTVMRVANVAEARESVVLKLT